MRGAEAVLERISLLGRPCVMKTRVAKGYRVEKLDERLRMERTRGEARLLHKAKLAGVECPTVLQVDDFEIVMSSIDGKRPSMIPRECEEAGGLLAKLHGADIIHGDYTPANLILGRRLYVIDFGLGFISNDIEDKAVDVFTMLRALGESGGKSEKDAFLSGYRSYRSAASVLKRVCGVESRVRYAP
ncbi:MAG: KEOPS complex kinase/ATPase Bud32 [Candidatus Micrarchaeota archaeon]